MQATGSLVGRFRTLLILLALFCLNGPCAHGAEPRSTPGLILATDGRTAACDVLTFTPDGTHLLAAGDDKVVRRWIVEGAAFSMRKLAPLRWPILREQRGAIFALALSPDREAGSVAIGGYGYKTGSIFVLDRSRGEVEHSLTTVTSPNTTWSITFSPSGKSVVYGTDKGEVYLWAPGKGPARLLPGSGGTRRNRVRLVSFVSTNRSETRFVSVAEDGKIRLWDASRPGARAVVLRPAFDLPRLHRVAISPDRRWLAAAGERFGAKVGDVKRVELIDLQEAQAGRVKRRSLPIPQADGTACFPQCLAFDPRGRRLAVGCRVHPSPARKFHREIGGLVFVFDLDSSKPLPAVLDTGYRPDALAFRPTAAGKDQLATAGGNNHEVRLWDISGRGTLLDTIESPGSCLWGVALGQPGKDKRVPYLAWKDQRAARPNHPNAWGAGEWRVFDLRKKSILNHPPGDFKPVLPRATFKKAGEDEGWRVELTTHAAVWRIVGPDTDVRLDDDSGLYKSSFNNLPRCYTFIPDPTGKKPVRLAIGHTWGVSLYECRPGDVRLARSMIGHDGEVMAVAPSADGKLLVTASRDQTLAGWSLEPWPTQPELGASFGKSRDGKLEVQDVSLGSPAWEALNPWTGAEDDDHRLAVEDVIEVLLVTVSDREKYLYDPGRRYDALAAKYHLTAGGARRVGIDAALRLLRNARVNQEYIFIKRVDGKDIFKQTTVRQRPLWRFFPERQVRTAVVRRSGQVQPQGKDWVVWRYRDFFYDTNSVRADNYVGWQVNRGPDGKPDFYPLERFRGTDLVNARGGTGFHQPSKVWAFFDKAFQEPEKVIFPEVQPPDVKLTVLVQPDKDKRLTVRLSIRPRENTPKQRLGRVINLWVNDYKYPLELPKADARGGIEVPRLVIRRNALRHGRNVLTLQAYNVEGGRGQDRASFDFDDGKRYTRTLRALCVGIGDYARVQGFPNLRCAPTDAEELKRVLEQHSGSGLYRTADVKLIKEDRATAREILDRLKEIGKDAHPDDWLILFLSGHGAAELKTADAYQPGSFYYVCCNTDRARPATKLTSKQLYEALAEINCAKLVLLDCCHSGDVASNPLRDLAREGVPFLILSACKGDQSALEPKSARYGKHGFFTQSLLDAIETSARAAGKKRMKPVSARDLGRSIRRRLAVILKDFDVDPAEQVPEFLPPNLTTDPVLCKP